MYGFGAGNRPGDADWLWLVERGGRDHAVMRFVFGLLAFIMAAASAAIGVAESLAAAAIVAVVAVGGSSASWLPLAPGRGRSRGRSTRFPG